MSKGGYKIINQGGLYYVSFATVAWVDLPAGRQVFLQEKITEI